MPPTDEGDDAARRDAAQLDRLDRLRLRTQRDELVAQLAEQRLVLP